MDPVLQSLIRLQELSLEQARLQKILSSFPLEIESIDRQSQEASSALTAARESVEEGRKRRRAHEAELQDLESRLSKYNAQLMQVKTNQEYKAMQKEIEGVRGSVGAVEEKILLLMDEIESLQKKVAGEEVLLAQRKKESDARKAEILKSQEEIAAEAAKVEAARMEASAGVRGEALEMFTRIAPLRNGIAVARALDERCLECKVRVRPQIFAEIRKNERIIQCDSCQRILYYLPPPAAPADGAGAAPPATPEKPGDAKADASN